MTQMYLQPVFMLSSALGLAMEIVLFWLRKLRNLIWKVVDFGTWRVFLISILRLEKLKLYMLHDFSVQRV